MKSRVISEHDRIIYNFVKKAARRRALLLWINAAAVIEIGFAAAALIINFIAIFFPVYNAEKIGFWLIAAGFVASIFYILFRWPDKKEAALYADSSGLGEKIITSFELLGESEGFAGLLKEDAVNEINEFDIRKRLPLAYPWKKYAALCTVVIVMVLCMLIPSDAKKLAVANHELAVKIEKAEDVIKKAEKKLEKAATEKKEEETIKELKKIIASARKEIKEVKGQKEIEKAKERLSQKLKEELKEQNNEKILDAMQPLINDIDIKKLAEYNKELSELSKDKGLSDKAKKELENLAEGLSDEEKKELLDKLAKAAQDGEVTDSEAAEAMSSLDNAEASQAAQSISQNSDSASQGSSDKSQNGTPSQSDGNASSDSEGKKQGENSSQSGQDGNKEGSSSGSAGSGNGQNGSDGNGGQGNGSSGSGWNYGSENGLEREVGSNKAEEVFITDKEIGDDENLTGRKQEFSGSTQSTGKKGQGSRGSKASLDSVIGDYSDRAYARVDNDEVPASMKDVVKEYFSSFEE